MAQSSQSLAENAALRYWSAFSEVQDSGITNPPAKELNAILDGTAPYATSVPNCDWGLDYGLGQDLPVEYARKAFVLGRLNVLYAFHLLKTGDKDGAVRALTAGLRFSRAVANGGSRFATLIAKDLLVSHLRAVSDTLRLEPLSATERTRLQQAVTGLGSHGVDWQSAMKQEMGVLNKPPWQESVSLYASVPQPLRDVIPNPKEVLEQKQELDEKLMQTRALL